MYTKWVAFDYQSIDRCGIDRFPPLASQVSAVWALQHNPGQINVASAKIKQIKSPRESMMQQIMTTFMADVQPRKQTQDRKIVKKWISDTIYFNLKEIKTLKMYSRSKNPPDTAGMNMNVCATLGLLLLNKISSAGCRLDFIYIYFESLSEFFGN